MPDPTPLTTAIAHFTSKGNVPTETYRDISGNEHLTAFMVAGAASEAMVADFRKAVDKAISQGQTRDEFRKDFDAIAERYGWQYTGERQWRTDIIYGTNLRQAQRAGRYARMTDPDMLERRPYWQVTKGMANEPRLDHIPFEGKVYPAGHEFWDSHFFPVGYGCTHKVMSLSRRDLEREGLTVEEPPKMGDVMIVNGEEVTIKPDPHWGTEPPALTPVERIATMEQVAQRLPPKQAESFQQHIVSAMTPMSDGDTDTFIQAMFAEMGVAATPDLIAQVKAASSDTTKPAIAAAIWEVLLP